MLLTSELCVYLEGHGHYGEWAAWSQCSQSCEGGVQLRHRVCDSPPPTEGGDDCVGAPTGERMCNLHPCPRKLPTNHIPSENLEMHGPITLISIQLTWCLRIDPFSTTLNLNSAYFWRYHKNTQKISDIAKHLGVFHCSSLTI